MENHQEIETVSLPMVPLRGLVAFPGFPFHFEAGRKKTVIALNQAMQNGQTVFLLAQKNDLKEDPSLPEDFYDVGVVATVQQMMRVNKDTLHVIAQCDYRARLVSVARDEPSFYVSVQEIPEFPPVNELYREASFRLLTASFEEYEASISKDEGEIYRSLYRTGDLGKMTDYIASTLQLPSEKMQPILEETSVSKRAELLLRLLQNETEIEQLENDIQEKTRRQVEKNQRDYYLREQMHVIADELGDGDCPLDEADAYRAKLRKFKLPEDTMAKLMKECDKLAKMPNGSHEATVVRGYLDLCTELPWNTHTTDRIDLVAAQKILDKDHYGLAKVKDRILELLAVRQLQPDVKGQILCLVGPPGVGKTSIARSIAKSMNRKYVRVSLGGVHDEAEIRGHRKTYIGAMPGRVMDAIKQAGTNNPLLLLDEIDKLSGDFHGDPASALLEVLDAEQNFSFVDHFLDVPFDLSQVLFVTTANDASAIPGPLLDRMELIEMPGYTHDEKFHIAQEHMIPNQLKRNGLDKRKMRLTDDALDLLIDGYTREAGVRTLERTIASVCRKTAKCIVGDGVKSVKVDASVVKEMLGPVKFKEDDVSHQNEVGVTNGLAWTAAGGTILQIEVALMEGTGKLELTGSLGDVMKESAKIAVSCVRANAKQIGVDPDFYKKYDIHIHAPEGAVPKDGPSAGVTMVTTLVSALTGIPVRGDVAMTGEITLRGRVLPIGGLREKSMAAYCNHISTVIIPKSNESNLADVDAVVKDSVRFIPAETIKTVLCNALTNFTWKECE